MMSNGKYRSVFHSSLSPADAFRAANDEMRTWLRSKDLDLDAVDRGDSRIGPRTVLLRSAANAADGSQTQRWELRENKDEDAWVSTLTVHAPATAEENASTWFWMEVEHVWRGSAVVPAGPIRASVPRLARGLLAAVPAYDSLAELTSEPVLVGRERVDELIDILCDPDRRYPAAVASPHPEIAFDQWRATITWVMRFLPGLASIFILDPLAEQAFRTGIGTAHAVWNGALRTYLPDVDPAVAEEAARHRVLSAARIAADPSRAAGIVSILPRRLSTEAPLPRALARVNRMLMTRGQETPSGADTDALRAQIEKLTADVSEAWDLAEAEVDRADTLFAARESALAELAEREQRVLDLDHQVRALQRRLVAEGRPADAYLPVDQPASPPATFAELLDWVETDLPHVEFTGDSAMPMSLDQRPEASTWVRSSWEALQALEAYAAAKATPGYAGDFRMWCEKPPSGEYVIPVGKVAMTESESVRSNARWRREREFPVPDHASGSGRVFMEAHIRIGASGAGHINPRLYFFDEALQTGLIYIGYLGPHLTNTRT